MHARNKKLDGDVKLEEMAMRTPGFSGADLANLLNEAAILAGASRRLCWWREGGAARGAAAPILLPLFMLGF